MTISVINALILPQIVLIYLNSLSVLATNETSVDETYLGFNGSKPCIVSSFRVTVAIKPANQTFRGTTYTDISPETSVARQTNCKTTFIEHYYRFNDSQSDLGTNSSHQSLLSIGFEVAADRSVDIHFKYVEVLCNSPRGCFRSGRVNICHPKLSPTQLEANNCYLMSESHHLDWIKPNRSHQCSHNSRMSIRNIVYDNEIPVMKGSFDVDVHFYRIDVISGEYSGQFNPISYCLKDWLLDTTILLILGSIICLFIALICVMCVIDNRKSAKRRISRKKNLRDLEDKKLSKDSKSHDSEPLGPSIEL